MQEEAEMTKMKASDLRTALEGVQVQIDELKKENTQLHAEVECL